MAVLPLAVTSLGRAIWWPSRATRGIHVIAALMRNCRGAKSGTFGLQEADVGSTTSRQWRGAGSEALQCVDTAPVRLLWLPHASTSAARALGMALRA
jgi:hypothetical protein